MQIFTLGFTRKPAAEFFGLLQSTGITRLIDVRRNNVSQLAGFTKRDDLAYFVQTICGADYVYEPLLAPSQELLRDYRGRRILWSDFATRFNEEIAARRIEKVLPQTLFAVPAVLLCSEPGAEHCHRRLVAEYLVAHWPDVTVRHL